MADKKPKKPAATKQEKLGEIGELLVKKYHEDKGDQVIKSPYKFDREKDMTINGDKAEVKCKAPFFTKDSFSIEEDQLWKCLQAAYFYYVSAPTTAYPDDEYTGGIFLIDMKHPSLKSTKHTTKQGTKMILFPRKQEAVKKISTVKKKKVLEEMRTLNSSRYTRS